MSYENLDKIADLCNPLLALALIVTAFGVLKNAAWPFLLRNGLAVIVVQQLAKYAQKRELWGEDFPSTHFAVALALCVGFWVLKRRLWPFILGFLGFYGALMLQQRYHTPAEMLGAFFAVPLALLFHWKKKAPLATN